MKAHFESMTAANTVIVDVVTGNRIPGMAFDPADYDRRYLMARSSDHGAVLGLLRRASDGEPVAVAPASGIGKALYIDGLWHQVVRFGPGTSEASLFWAFAVSP